MKRLKVSAGLLVLLTTLSSARPGAAQTGLPPGCEAGILPHGALSLICVPVFGWNGQLVVFAHGYVNPDQPLNFYHLTLPDGTNLVPALQSLGFAFATTSYRKNGLAILEGVEDVKELVTAFNAGHGVPTRTYMTGVSEGGLVTALLAERAPGLFYSAVATCGPIGSFIGQIDYLGDFRVLFDYFFPGVIPGSPIDIPPSVMADWFTVYVPAVQQALAASPAKALELMRVSHAAYDPANPATIVQTTLEVLPYNIFATNDAVASLGGNPYGNRLRWYFGSSNDWLLNRRVQRFTASPRAVRAMLAYETRGTLTIPLITLHTTRDAVVPFAHETFYAFKVDPTGRGRFVPIPVQRYGHCAFTTSEVLGALALATQMP